MSLDDVRERHEFTTAPLPNAHKPATYLNPFPHDSTPQWAAMEIERSSADNGHDDEWKGRRVSWADGIVSSAINAEYANCRQSKRVSVPYPLTTSPHPTPDQG